MSSITRREAGTHEQPPNTQSATLVGVALAMGEPRGSEFLAIVGLDDRIGEYRRTLGEKNRSDGPGVRNSLSHGGAPLSAEQEELLRQMIREIQRREQP